MDLIIQEVDFIIPDYVIFFFWISFLLLIYIIAKFISHTIWFFRIKKQIKEIFPIPQKKDKENSIIKMLKITSKNFKEIRGNIDDHLDFSENWMLSFLKFKLGFSESNHLYIVLVFQALLLFILNFIEIFLKTLLLPIGTYQLKNLLFYSLEISIQILFFFFLSILIVVTIVIEKKIIMGFLYRRAILSKKNKNECSQDN